MADTSNFAGPYVGFQMAAAGVELDGDVKSKGDDVGETTTGTAGKVAIIGGLEVGYAFPLGDSGILLDIGANYIAGGAKMATSNTDTWASDDVIFEVDDMYTGFIAPSFALSNTSSLYVKLGYTHATVSVTGDVTKPDDMEGATYAIGTRTVLESGLFVRTEAGLTEFDSLTATGLGSSGNGGTANSKSVETTTTVTADPTVAYGSISIGMRF